MARGYTSTAMSYCETVAWEGNKASSRGGQDLHDIFNGQASHETRDGTVQQCSLSVDFEAQNTRKGTNYALCVTPPSPENSPPKLSIAPIPSRLCMSIPPVNFGTLEESAIYRSGYPKPENYSFLANLGLKTILTLVPEPLSKEYTEFIHSNGIRHVQIHIPANKDGHIKITPERMCMALGVVLDRKHHPLLIHCNRGKHRTGCVTACFRKVNGLSDDDAVGEYRDYSYPKCRDDDMTFIRSFEPSNLLSYAQSHGWPVTPPPEPTDELWHSKKDSFIFSLEDIAAFKVPEEPDQSL